MPPTSPEADRPAPSAPAADGVRVGVDVGGTKVLAVEVDDVGAVRAQARRSVPGDATPATLEDALTEAVLAVAGDRPLAAVGVSLAGLVDVEADVVRFCTHLPWRQDAVRPRLAQRWGVPVALENDATCAAVAESRLGVARGAGSFALVTVGTGIGAAVVLDGEVWRGAGGMAGELGHVPVVGPRVGLPCPCGLSGCWEQYCSGRALHRIVAQRRPDLPDGAAVTAAALAGDADAVAACTEVGGWLGAGLAAVVTAFDPALLVVGGGVSEAGELLLGPARDALAGTVYAAPWRTLPELRPAACGPEAGAVGAALLAADL